MASATQAENTVDIVGKVLELGALAAGANLLDISTEGLGHGLPPKVPMLWRRKAETGVSLMSLIEEHRLAPARIKGAAKVETLQSFIDLVNRHKSPDSALFGKTSMPGVRLAAIIDYHTQTHVADWMGHRIVYDFPLTEEFKAWVEFNGKPMEQAKFAAFLEDHVAEIASPMDAEAAEYERLFREKFATPAQLLDLARSLEVFVKSRVKSAARLQSGERSLVFETENLNGAGEPVDIPGVFMVSVPAWIDGDPIRVPARLRYRATESGLVWFYQLYRIDKWLRDQVINDLTLAAEETGLPHYLAAPEA